ncbi:unnamed protein product [Linum tenue]|uniref:Secreted protein n=1 Tax=Linum tenue TaxID=586396 RepID=A0AAV0N636_9ROSI|nr:unnamed protein product [Linum tenue]
MVLLNIRILWLLQEVWCATVGADALVRSPLISEPVPLLGRNCLGLSRDFGLLGAWGTVEWRCALIRRLLLAF